MLQRTEPSESDDPMLTLRSVLASYVDYVTENRNTYVSLLRGTASGDPQMREVFEQTRDIMAKRTLDQLPKIGLTRTPQVELAVRGLDRVCRGSHHQLAPSARHHPRGTDRPDGSVVTCVGTGRRRLRCRAGSGSAAIELT